MADLHEVRIVRASSVRAAASTALRHLPRYRVVTQLGAGGTANVHLAVLSQAGGFHKLTVLKSLQSHRADDEELVMAFRHEARLAARLKHPNLVEVYELVEDNARPVLVMEYLAGASLREIETACRQTGVRMSLRHHLEVIEKVCAGLQYCHRLTDYDGSSMGLVHRDVSPHNVYVTTLGETKLLDFGIAKVMGKDGDTQTGVVKGKIRYMAPEQMFGEAIDHRADIYAVGVLLWEAAAGRPMWHEVSEAVVMQRTINGEVPRPEPLVDDCPAGLVDLAMRCLATDPAERISSCDEIRAALQGFVAQLPAPPTTLGVAVQQMFSARLESIQSLVSQTLAGRTSTELAPDTIAWRSATEDPAPRSLRAEAPARRPQHRSATIAIAMLAIATVGLMLWPGSGRPSPNALAAPASAPPEVVVVDAAEPLHVPDVGSALEPGPAPTVVFGQSLGAEPPPVHPVVDTPPEPRRGPAPAARKRAPRKKRASAPAATHTPDCTPPYTIDDAGVKRFKRNCL